MVGICAVQLGLYQTYTSAHLFDTLVTGLAHCAVHRRGRVREQLGDSSEIHQRRVRRIDLKYTTSGSRFLHSFDTDPIFVTDITDYIRGEKSVMWRNFRFL